MKHPTVNAAEARVLSIPLTLEARADGEAGFTLRGYAAVFDRLSNDLGGFRERIKRGAFRKALDDGQDVVLLWQHDDRYVLARTGNGTLELREDVKGLHVFASVAETSYASDLRVLMQRGDIDKMSFAFTVAEDKWTERNAEDGTSTVERDVLAVQRLYDVSVVAVPAYPQTSADMRALPVLERDGATIIAPVGLRADAEADDTPTDGDEPPAEELDSDVLAEADDAAAPDDLESETPGETEEERDAPFLESAAKRLQLRETGRYIAPRTAA